MRTLFLQAPSFTGFDGGAGARYQARREVRSFWFPTWLGQLAAMVPDSKLIDAAPHDIELPQIVAQARNFDLAVLHTSTPSFVSDVKTIAALKAANPQLKAGFVGAKVAVEPQASLDYSPLIDFVCRNEFEFTVKEIAEGRDWSAIAGLSYRKADGTIVHNEERAILEDLDVLPFITPVYKRDLVIENYYNGYLKHPYMSFYTGRGCKSRCTFCLWPQTVGGHRYRVRSVDKVVEEVTWAKAAFPQVKEFFFDDDTLTDNAPRSEAIARGIGKLGIDWACNAKANVKRDTLKVMRDNGLRLLLVGYESGNQKILHNIKKGLLVDVARRFTKDCHELGIKIYGTFILGLPGETKETIEQTIRFAKEINPHTIQVSLAAPYPGTFLYRQALENGWLDQSGADLLDATGDQMVPLHYPHLSHTEICTSVDDFYRRFYFRAPKIAAIASEMVCSPHMMVRRLREGVEFFSYLRRRRGDRHLNRLIVTADDFGLAHEVNEAVEIAHGTGVLSAASLMVAGAAADDAIARARRLPDLRVGLHLVLVEGCPTLPPERIPDLVDASGLLRNDMARLGFDIAFRPAVRRQLSEEITAQFTAYHASRLPLDHVTGHKHFHLHPVVAAEVIRIGRTFGMTAIRVPQEPAAVINDIEPGAVRPAAHMLRTWSRVLAGQANAAGLTFPDAVFGLAWSGQMTAPRLAGLLQRLPAGVVEIYTHPATGDRFAGHGTGYRYREELAALTDADCVEAARASGYMRGGYCDL